MHLCLASLSLTLTIGHALAAAPASPAAPKAPPPPLEGVVLAPDGRPVEGAVVMAHPSGLRDAPLRAQTDAKGAFRITLTAGGLHDLRVEKSGLATARRQRVWPGHPLTIRLDRAGTITGVVRDGTSRRPIVGGRVEALEESAWAPHPGAGPIETTTDAQGRFELAGIGLKLMTVSAVAPGYSCATRSDVRVGANVALALFPGASISGVILAANGQPVGGALVRTEAETGFPQETSPRTETTDAQGRFVVAGVNAGRRSVTARAQGMVPGVAWVNVEPKTDVRVEVRMGPGATLAGRLVNAAGEPVIGRAALQTLIDNPVPASLADILRADTGADGHFRIERVPLGSHSLAVTAPGFAARRVDFTLEKDADLGDVALEPGLSIRGRVRDRTGAGIAGARVRGFGTPDGAGQGLETASERDGSFALGGLEAGTYRLSVEAAGYAGTERAVAASAEAVDIVLSAGGGIVGSVVDARGRPVTSYRIEVRPAPGEAGGLLLPRMETVGTNDGCFRIEDLAKGAYVVFVSAPGHPAARVSNVRVESGATADLGPIHLRRGGVVRGTVVDSAGVPILGATVSIPVRDWNAPGATAVTAVTDADGTFELSGIAPGLADLLATHPEYAAGRVAGIEIDPAQDPAETRIVLAAGGRIEGAVRRRDGSPAARVMVAIRPYPSGDAFGWSPNSVWPLRDDGTFSIEHVAPGRYNVSVVAGDRDSVFHGQQRDVDVREGETTAVEFVTREILVVGHVARNGQPAPGLRVILEEVQFQTRMHARLTTITRDDGTYELRVGEPGLYSASVESAYGKLSFPGREVELPDAETFVLDFDFSGASLAGVVVEEATGKLLGNAFVAALPKRQDGRAGAFSATGPDGDFALEVEPGEYVVEARVQGYSEARQAVTVPEGGLAGLYLTLAHGAAITGKVVDPAGRGLGAQVSASASWEGRPGPSTTAVSLDDGSFRLEGLSEGPYDLSAVRDGRFAVRRDVTPGDAAVTLVLRPGGRALITVHETDGAPVEGAWALGSVAGIQLAGRPVQSDANGMIDMAVPAANVTVRVWKDRLRGRATFEAVEDAVVSVDVTVSPQ